MNIDQKLKFPLVIVSNVYVVKLRWVANVDCWTCGKHDGYFCVYHVCTETVAFILNKVALNNRSNVCLEYLSLIRVNILLMCFTCEDLQDNLRAIEL